MEAIVGQEGLPAMDMTAMLPATIVCAALMLWGFDVDMLTENLREIKRQETEWDRIRRSAGFNACGIKADQLWVLQHNTAAHKLECSKRHNTLISLHCEGEIDR